MTTPSRRTFLAGALAALAGAAISDAAKAASLACPADTDAQCREDMAAFLDKNSEEYQIIDPSRRYNVERPYELAYTGSEAPGSMLVSNAAFRLYLVQEDGKSVRAYEIAIGEGSARVGGGYMTVGNIKEYPSWTQTPTQADGDAPLSRRGAPGLNESPMGAAAIYPAETNLMYRVHGSNNPLSIGRQTTDGCIRLYNGDILDLVKRVKKGAKIIFHEGIPAGIPEQARKPKPAYTVTKIFRTSAPPAP